MNMKVISIELGTSLVPFSPQPKCWPIAVAAGISALGGLAGSILNSSSQKSANATNLEAVRQTNETNRAIAAENNRISQAQFDANQKWLREQFYAQRAFEMENAEYNSPQRYVERLRAAGINPAMAIGSMPNGMPSSSVGSVGAPSPSQLATGYAESGHVDPVHYDLSGIADPIGHAVNAYYQNQLINEQTKGQSINNEINRATAAVQVSKQIQELRNLQADYHQKLASTKLSQAEREKVLYDSKLLDRQIAVFVNQMDALSKQPSLNNDLISAQKDEVKSRTVLNQIEASIKPALASAQIRLSQSQMNVFTAQVQQVLAEAQESLLRGDKLQADVVSEKLRQRLQRVEVFREENKLGFRTSSAARSALANVTDYLGEVITGNLLRVFAK